MLSRLQEWAQQLKTHLLTLYLAYRHPQTPLLAKWVALVVVAYAFSPVDLIPDFIPVLGYVDDVLLLPAGIWLAIRLIPDEVLQHCRERAEEIEDRPQFRWMIGVIVLVWLLLAVTVIGAIRS